MQSNRLLTLCGALVLAFQLWAQAIPVPLTYTKVYDFVDELIDGGVVLRQTAVRPYTRQQMAAIMVEAASRDSLLDRRQRADLVFYLDEFALERDTMVSRYVQYSDGRTYSLSLGNPQFSYMTKNKLFKMQIEPIIGMDVYGGKKGAIIKRWWGAEIKMDIAHHLSIWGSLRDVSYNGAIGLKDSYFPTDNDKMYGARINQGFYYAGGRRIETAALNMVPGTQYKEATYGGDFSDSKGGISLYTWWGSISVQRENLRWGDSYHCSNILSERAPAVPMVSLQLTPCSWFQFDYFHAWLVSNVLDSTRYYLEDAIAGKEREYRPHNKFMAANMFTFTPIKYISFSLGNSIVYAEKNVQAAYFIPIAFYKSLDHLLTKGVRSENQNSQVFFSLNVRPVDHLKLYGSFFLDEFNSKRLKRSNPEKNPISYLVGFEWSGWPGCPVKGLSLKGEFTRSYIACYTHSIAPLTYESNSFSLGHYMGDNAQSIFVEASYRPYKGMLLKLSYTNDTKYNSYAYLRDNISETIAQKPFNKVVYRNEDIALDFIYEVHPHMYLRANLTYNNARGYDNPATESTLSSEYTGDAQYYLNKYCPSFYQGKNVTAMVGFNIGF